MVKILISFIFLLLTPLNTYAEERIAKGIFGKGSTHGSVEIHKQDGKWFITFDDDFFHEGSPDPWVALGKDGFNRSGIIGKLTKFKGAQSFPIKKLNPTEFNEVYVWCVEHNSSLGRAKITWQ